MANSPKKPEACSELAATVARLAIAHGSRGKPSLDSVVARIQKDIGQIQRDEIVDAIVAFSKRPQRTKSELQKQIADLKQRARYDQGLRTQIDTLENQLRSGQYTTKTRAQKIYDNRIEDLRFKRDELKRAIKQEIDELRPRTNFERFVAEPFNAFRTLMTSYDLPPVLRQGGFIAFGNPARAARSLGPALKAFANERTALRINDEIANRPNHRLYQRSKLYIAPIDTLGKLSKLDESFMTKSELLRKIPGIRASERGYNTLLNLLRADSFDVMTANLSKTGTPSLDESKAIANFINNATGRGGLGKFENSAVGLNTFFFAPRYWTSRVNMIMGGVAPRYTFGGNDRTTKLIRREYAKYLIGMGTTLALLDLAGVKVEYDPRSSDFLKPRIGNTRLDILSGLQQPFVFFTRMATSETKSIKTGEVRKLENGFGKTSRLGVAVTYGRTKLSPLASTVVDVLDEKSVVGEKIDTPYKKGARVAQNVIPLIFRDIYETMEEEGVPTATALGLISLFGAGMQTFDPDKPKEGAK